LRMEASLRLQPVVLDSLEQPKPGDRVPVNSLSCTATSSPGGGGRAIPWLRHSRNTSPKKLRNPSMQLLRGGDVMAKNGWKHGPALDHAEEEECAALASSHPHCFRFLR
jgi:hypothetical protein